MLLRLDAAQRGPPLPAGDVQSRLGGSGEDAAVREKRPLLSRAPGGRPADVDPERLGASAGAGTGAGPGGL